MLIYIYLSYKLRDDLFVCDKDKEVLTIEFIYFLFNLSLKLHYTYIKNSSS